MTDAVMFDRRDAGAVRVSGADTFSYLESLASQRIDTLADGDGCYSLLLEPTGKLGVDLRVLRVRDEAWLDCEPGYGHSLAEGLERFRIRVDVEVEDRSEEWGVLSVKGGGADDVVRSASGVDLPTAPHAHVEWSGTRVVRADWPGVPGLDVVGPIDILGEVLHALPDAGASRGDHDTYERTRIEAGIPRLGVDLDEKTIAQEAFLDQRAVDFSKGCFLGQELVRRIEDRGRVTRQLRRLRIEGAVPPAGAELVAGDKGVGSLTSVAAGDLGSGTSALGFTRAEIEPGDEVVVRWDGGQASGVVEEIAVTP